MEGKLESRAIVLTPLILRNTVCLVLTRIFLSSLGEILPQSHLSKRRGKVRKRILRRRKRTGLWVGEVSLELFVFEASWELSVLTMNFQRLCTDYKAFSSHASPPVWPKIPP